MSLNNLTAVRNEAGEIVISDAASGEAVYLIPAAFMYDANDSGSSAVTTELTDHGNGKYTITISADSAWINADDRAFPVTIDPPIYTGSSSSSVTDIYMPTSGASTTNSTSLYVGSTWRSYWKLNTLPSLPESAYITNATFTASCYTTTYMQGYVAVYDVTTNWDSTLNWSKVTATTNPQGVPAENYTDFQELYCYEEYDGYYNNYMFKDPCWNITPIVKKWYSGENYGLTMAPAAGTTFTGTAMFRSSTYSDDAKRPQLCITYRDMKGLEDYWSYSSQSAGFAGTGSVNNATGNLVFTIPTLTSTDALMPFTPALVYNSALAGKSYISSNAQTAFSSTYMPFGFKLNINETLIKKSYTDEAGTVKYLFVWADSDGTEHYFLPTSTANTYEDEDGLLLTMVEDTSVCTITDSGKNVKTFQKRSTLPAGVVSAWYLTEITDKNGNKLIFEFDSSTRPITVKLDPNGGSPAITQLQIAYSSNNRPYMIWNPTSGEAVILRYSSTVTGSIGSTSRSYLRQVVRAHGTGTVTEAEWLAFYNSNANIDTSKITVDAIADYTYSSSGLLTSVTNNLSKYKIEYGYDTGNRVVSVKEWAVGTTNTLGQQLSLSYGSSSTVIRTSGTDDIFNTSDDLITTYGFDSEGRAISCYTTDLDRTQIYGASNGQYVGEDNEKARNNLKSSVQTTQQSSNYLLNGGFEQTASGYIPYWTKTGNASGGSGIIYEGEACATLSVNSSVTSSSIYQYVYLDEGDYSLSMYINTHEISNGVKVYLKAESVSNTAHSVVQEIPVNEYYATVSYAFAGLNFSADPSTSGGKEQFKVSVVLTGAPAETNYIDVDNIMLSRTTGTAEYDHVHMGHFEDSSSSYDPEDFWYILDYEETPITVVDSGIDAFGDVLKIDIDLDEFEFVQQDIVFATDTMKAEYDNGYYYSDEPQLFTVSGWGMGTAQGYAGTSLFGIRIHINYYDGSQYGTTESYDFDFDKGITGWQFISGGFTTNPSKGMLESITIMLMYNDHPGVGYFDSISLVQDSSTIEIYDYEASGYLSSYQNGWGRSWYAYNDDDQLVRTISSDRTIIDYEYDSKNRVKEEYHKQYTGSGICTPTTVENNPSDVLTNYYYSYGYNTFGLLYYVWTYDGSDDPEESVTFTEYHTQSGSHIFGTVDYEIDALGNTTRYFHDEKTGRLLAVTYPEGNGVCYAYDAIGNLTEVLPAELLVTEIEHVEEDPYAGDWTWIEYIYNYDENPNSTSVSYEYDPNTNRLSGIATESTEYTFVYDVFGNTTDISAGNHDLAEYVYNDYNGKLDTLIYGNGLEVRYIYDILDRISEIQYNIGENSSFETVYSYTYDSAGNIFSVTDHLNQEATVYKYDSQGKLDRYYVYDTEAYLNLYGTSVRYDEDSRVSMVFHYLDYSCPADNYHGTTYSNSSYYSYSYDTDTGNLSIMRLNGDAISGTITPQYDAFGRTTQRIVDISTNPDDDFYDYQRVDTFYDKWTFTYTENYGDQTGQIASVTKETRKGENTALLSSVGYQFTYDDNGNITQIANASGVIQNKYYYDDLGQLIREDNRALGYSYTYSYDNAGNILSKKRYAFTTGTLTGSVRTTSWLYEDSTWGDLLTEFSGYTIEYDEIGNPTKIGYYENGYWNEHYELIWQGRQLMSYVYSEEGGADVQFSYNADGIRTSKTVNGVEHRYYLDGSQITAEMWTQNNVEYLLYYLYDENDAPIGLQYRTSNYASGVFDFFFFDKNLQGDIIGIYNADGEKICTYTYDAWGVCELNGVSGVTLSAVENYVAVNNPFRYRGYYYDTQTGLYYLQSRYYNPEWGRFLNADIYINANADIIGFNLYAYCSNNPIMFLDITGEGKVWDWIKKKASDVGNWFSETFGAALYSSNSYEAMDVKTVYGGIEGGFSSSAVIAGDNSKPITFYAQKASDWWKIWEYKVGINVNIGEGGFNIGIGVGEATASICVNNTSVELVTGANKMGITISQDVNFKEHTAGAYTQAYIRPWTIAATAAAIYFTAGAAVPAALQPFLR